MAQPGSTCVCLSNDRTCCNRWSFCNQVMPPPSTSLLPKHFHPWWLVGPMEPEAASRTTRLPPCSQQFNKFIITPNAFPIPTRTKSPDIHSRSVATTTTADGGARFGLVRFCSELVHKQILPNHNFHLAKARNKVSISSIPYRILNSAIPSWGLR